MVDADFDYDGPYTENSLEESLLDDSEKIAEREITKIQIEIHERLQHYYDKLDEWGQKQIGTQNADVIQAHLNASCHKAQLDLRKMRDHAISIVRGKRMVRDLAIKVFCDNFSFLYA